MRRWFVVFASLMLTACAQPGASPESDALLPLGPALNHFVAEGRISLRQGARSDHLRFRWEHGPANDTVLLMSPLGQGMAQLERDASGARLKRPGQPDLVAPDLQQLAQNVFGAPLPLELLADRMRGVDAAGVTEFDGWRVQVTDTAPYRQRRLLRVLEASRDDIELRMIVDDWDSSDE